MVVLIGKLVVANSEDEVRNLVIAVADNPFPEIWNDCQVVCIGVYTGYKESISILESYIII